MAGKRKPPTGLGEKNKGPKGAAASTTASSAATMETMLDESMRGMKARQHYIYIFKFVYVYCIYLFILFCIYIQYCIWYMAECQVGIINLLGIKQPPPRKNGLAILNWADPPWLFNWGRGSRPMCGPPQEIPIVGYIVKTKFCKSSHGDCSCCISWTLINPCCPQLFPPCCSLLFFTAHSCWLALTPEAHPNGSVGPTQTTIIRVEWLLSCCVGTSLSATFHSQTCDFTGSVLQSWFQSNSWLLGYTAKRLSHMIDILLLNRFKIFLKAWLWEALKGYPHEPMPPPNHRQGSHLNKHPWFL